jgi:hypothetical protein
VENSDTFDSLRTVLTANPGRVALIGWGAGAAFEVRAFSRAWMSAADRDQLLLSRGG